MTAPAGPGVDFDRNRIPLGELIAGACGLLLILFEFLDWYGAKVSGAAIGGLSGVSVGGADAWQAFSFIDILLFLCGLIALGVAVMRGLNRTPDMPYPTSTLVTGAGALAVLLILFRIIDKPAGGGSVGPVHVSITLKIGIFLALLAAAGIAYGGWRAMQEAGTSFGSLGGAGGFGGGAGGGGGGTAPTTPMPPAGGGAGAGPGVPGGGAAGVSPGKEGPGAPHPGTSTGGPSGDETTPPAASAGDPVPGSTAGQTPPGLAGEPPAGEGTHPPGL